MNRFRFNGPNNLLSRSTQALALKISVPSIAKWPANALFTSRTPEKGVLHRAVINVQFARKTSVSAI